MLQKSTLTFIKNLQKNNVKEWFDANRKSYDAAKADFIQLVDEALKQHSQTDKDIDTLTAKESVFRINRDIRFSKDKTPYKNHIAAGFARGGKKSIYAGYYLHIEPGNNSFVGGGLWTPEADVVKKIRQEIDYNLDEFVGIIQSKTFQKIYGGLYRDKEVMLSRAPKGYEEDNKAINYIKMKSFIAMKPIKDEELTEKKLVTIITEALSALYPLILFLNAAIEG